MMKKKSRILVLSKFILLSMLFLNSCSEEGTKEIDNLEQGDEELTASISSEANSGFSDETIEMKAWTRGSSNGCKPHREVVTRLHNYLDTRDYRIEFDVKFSKYFDFDRGGKFGYGMVVGKGVTGCKGDDAKDNEGGSFRVMWRNRTDPASPTQGCVIEKGKKIKADIIPYVYYRDMSGDCGNDFGKTYPIERDKWYKIIMTFKANTDGNKDGTAKLEIGPNSNSLTTVLNRTNIRWSETAANQKVTELYYHFFRGGNDKNWASHSKGEISVRNVKLGF